MKRRLSTLLRDDERIRGWLAYGSHVDEFRRILYLETPKAACTSIKHFLRRLVLDRPLRFNPRVPATQLEMIIHDRYQSPLPSLNEFSPERADEIATGEGWFRFCVVRHPVDRFFAAWRDKVFLAEPEYERFLPGDGRKFVEFSDFLNRVLRSEQPDTCDFHWRSQVALLLPDQITYTRIYSVDAVQRLREDLAEHLGRQGIDDKVPPLARLNEGLPVSPGGFISADVAASLRRFYEADFRWFGFPDWQASNAPPTTAADFVNGFTDAIYERNRTIAAHALVA